MRTSTFAGILLLALTSVFQIATADELPTCLIELSVARDKFTGRLAAETDNDCVIFQRDGRMKHFRNRDISDAVEVDSQFKPFSVMEHRDALLKEFDRELEVKTTLHYVVVAKRGNADRYAQLFEKVYRQCYTYFSVRGFEMTEPEFPLIAVVFPNEADFVRYCRSEGSPPQQNVVGYYITPANRVALFERSTSGRWSEDEVDNTVIHEAVHQFAFNTGIHLRAGFNPQWLVEGLATMMEADGIRRRQNDDRSVDRVNTERLRWFNEYRAKRRQKNSLASFLSSDNAFKTGPLDAYSQAWALCFYLVENRSAEFANYLKAVANRPPLTEYRPQDRLADFKEAFGGDIDSVERGMLRFYDKLGN